ncbi:hypothetical protein [Methylophilus sp. QUAN]|uniref:hypothetical protein n=1 Tax=Methylophilus sp. QUAN TaxID=2781020 RepID=UPI001890AD71|nr:hypothetical protein [Methylophilus sp. QUAN]MBF4989788.1 hypothetical protein [Methylophilus sp. QUAN]
MCNSAWNSLRISTSTTESERYLVNFARKVFLSLWSFPNVYTDEGKHGKGNGKELCDLLVVFGNDIILFSDKACKFTPHSDIEIAWSRWFRKAIEKSAKQLSGAESWIRRFPDRLFLDPACTSTLPVQLPRLSDCRIHLVAVARGSREYAKKYWGEGGSSSLFINTTLVEDDHKNSPFCIGWSLPNKRLVHVLDETTLDILLNELDTISDFVSYLTKKEKIFCNHELDFIVPGEEELLAFYLSHFDYKKNEHHFPEIPDGALVALNEGDWQRFINSKSYASRYEANEISYIWDALIEFQNRHIIDGSAESLTGDDSPEVYERVMRIMASENRLTRRVLGESFYIANNLDKKGKRYTRTVMSSAKSGRAYIFMALSSPDGCSVSDYKAMRRSELMLYIQGCKLNYKKVDEVLGIVFEPGQKHLSSVDFLYVNFGLDEIDTDFVKEIKRDLKDFNMWQTGAIKLKMIRNLPFPHIESLVLRRVLWFMSRLNQTIRNIWNRIQKQE